MVVISLQKDKCIGCNVCKETVPLLFQLSKKDGKAILLNSIKKKDFFVLKINNHDLFEDLKQASQSCPVKIIKVIKV